MLHRARHTFIVREIGFMATPLCYCDTQKVPEAFTVHHFLGLVGNPDTKPADVH